MDALVMAGGRGERLDAPVEKPLFEVGGRPMVLWVLDALAAAEAVDRVTVAVSAHTRETRAVLAAHDVAIIDTPGAGYVADLAVAVEALGPPVLTVAADLPLLAADALDRVLEAHGDGSTTVCVPAPLKEQLGVSVDRTLPGEETALAPTGLNVVADGDADRQHLTHDVRLAVNVNRPRDAAVAEALL